MLYIWDSIKFCLAVNKMLRSKEFRLFQVYINYLWKFQNVFTVNKALETTELSKNVSVLTTRLDFCSE